MQVSGPVALLKEIATASNEATTPRQAIQHALWTMCRHMGWAAGHAHFPAPNSQGLRASDLWQVENPRDFDDFAALSRIRSDVPGTRLTDRAFNDRTPAWDNLKFPDTPDRISELARALDVVAAIAIPVFHADESFGVLEFYSSKPFALRGSIRDTLEQVGRQLGCVFQREKMLNGLRETEEKYRGLVDTARLRPIISTLSRPDTTGAVFFDRFRAPT